MIFFKLNYKMESQTQNDLIYVDSRLCSHIDSNYCNKCFHRKTFENNNIPYKTKQSKTNNITTTYTFILY